MTPTPIMELADIEKRFGGSRALSDVNLEVHAGEVTCLLGDNGAGKSTLIKIMSGVHQPSAGTLRVDGTRVQLAGPRDAQRLGIATVHQDDESMPLMSVWRNFFLGHEPTKGHGPWRRLDQVSAREKALAELRAMGLRRVTDPDQSVGTMSGGERQVLAIGRALHFGARMLILDEPTSALGVKEAGFVLRLIRQAKSDGIAVVFITHNAHHAMSVGDRFTVLIHGTVAAEFRRGDRRREEILGLMAGGEEMESLQLELEELDNAAAR